MYYFWHAIFAYRKVQRKKYTIIKEKNYGEEDLRETCYAGGGFYC